MNTQKTARPTGLFGTFLAVFGGTFSRTHREAPPEKVGKKWDGDELTYDTISTYNLHIGALRSYLKHSFKEFEEKDYYPVIRIKKDKSEYIFECPAKLTDVSQMRSRFQKPALTEF